MATNILISTIFLQMNSDWRPEIPSLVLGFVLGILLVLAVLRARPFFQRHFKQAKGWLQGRISWMRSGVEVRFQGETAVSLEKHHLGSAWAELSAIFVEPRLMNPVAAELLENEDRGATQMALLWPDLAAEIGAPVLPSSSLDQLIQNGRRVIVSGAAGAGKSTLLATIAQRFALADLPGEDNALADIVPIFIHLVEMEFLETANEAEAPTPLDMLAAALQKRSSPLTAPGIPDMLQRKFESGQVLLLIDGWDEIVLAKRPLLTAWLRALLTAHKKTRIFMSAGLTGYGDLLPFGFTHTRIMPWRVGDIERFLVKWSAALGLADLPPLENVWHPGQSPLETSLRFWLLALGNETQRPSTMTELLATTLPLFQKRKKGDPLSPLDADIQAFWQLIAARLKQKDSAALSREMVTEGAATLSPGEDGEVDKGQANRLRKSVETCRLFVRWGSGDIGFLSPVWLDYFTAVSLQSGQSANVERQVQNPRWQNVWRFYAGLADPAHLAQKVLAADGADQEGRFQTAVWLRETKAPGKWVRQTMIDLGHMARQASLPPALRLRALATMVQTQEAGLQKFLTQLLTAPDPHMRQLATAVIPLLKDDKIIALLADRLADEDPIVRQTAVNSLALLQYNPLTERPLITALIGEDEAVGLLTAELLARNGGPGIQILKEAAEDEDIQVRRAAVSALSFIDEAWVEPMLVEIERHDDEWFVRSAASSALELVHKRQQPHPWHPVRAADQPWLENMALRVGQPVPSGRAAVTFVLKVLTEAEDDALKVAAVQLLGQLPAQEALPTLKQLTENEAEQTAVREAAYFAYQSLNQVYES